MENTSTENDEPRKKRTRYGDYLSKPHPSPPKTTKWRISTGESSSEDTFGMDLCTSLARPEYEDVSDQEESSSSQSCSSIPADSKVPVHTELSTETDESVHFDSESEGGEDDLENITEDITEDSPEDLEDEEADDNQEACASNFSDGDKYIYPGAQITLATSILLTIAFVCRHGISGQALLDLLTYVELHCLAGSLCTRSIKMLRNFFRNSKAPMECHFYCCNTSCRLYFGKNKDKLPGICKACQSKQDQASPPYFLMSQVESSLKNLFATKGFLELLKYRFTRSKKSASNIEDVYDGKWYQKHFTDEGFFKGQPQSDGSTDEVHISLQLNTDGVSIFKSSKYSVWPVFMVINDLHPKLRFSRSYRILMGMWFGADKPSFDTFMLPFAKSFNQLYTEGVKVTLPDGSHKTVKAIVLSSVFDAPARCLFQNFTQFNGYSGCPFCLTVGEPVKTSARGHTQTYPFDLNSSTGHGTPRTHKSTLELAQEIHNHMITGTKKTLHGVKGYSCFSFVKKFDIIRSVALDYMHGVTLGVMKMCTKLWFDVSLRDKPFNIYKKVKDVDIRLMNITPPSCISRPPRPISSHIKFWKASEYRSFLLFYATPCLWGLLPEEYYQHLLLLVQAMFFLLSDSISGTDLKTANTLLKLYCLKFGQLYGARYCTSNVHSLLHYSQKVHDLGPLWCNSCFPYEDFNGDISKLFHGTRGVEIQVLSAAAVNQQIPLLALQLRAGSPELDFYNTLISRGQKIKLQEELFKGAFLVGSFTNACSSEDYFALLFQKYGQITDLRYFKRVSIKGVIFHSKSYRAAIKRNSSTIMYRVNDKEMFGIVSTYVKFFLQCSKSGCSAECRCKVAKYAAIVDELKIDNTVKLARNKISNTVSPNKFIVPLVKKYRKLVVVELKDVLQQCVWLDVGVTHDFVAVFPNMYEKD